MTKKEKAILSYFVDEMESKGYTRKNIFVTFSKDVLDIINKKHNIALSDVEIDALVNKLMANEHIKYGCSSGGKNSNLQITSKGVAVVTSLRAKEEHLKNRTRLKKVADFSDEHKGILALVAILLALVSFILRLKGII